MYNNTIVDALLTIAGETLECVDSLAYHGSVISRDGSAQKGSVGFSGPGTSQIWSCT